MFALIPHPKSALAGFMLLAILMLNLPVGVAPAVGAAGLGDPFAGCAQVGTMMIGSCEEWSSIHRPLPDSQATRTVNLVADDAGARVFSVARAWDASAENWTCLNEGCLDMHFVTLAHDASTGEEIWARKWDAVGHRDLAYAVATAPDGSAVYVGGFTHENGGPNGVLLAYDSVNGDTLWEITGDRRGDGPLFPWAATVHPSGELVFFGGVQGNLGVSAYHATNGTRAWRVEEAPFDTSAFVTDLQLTPEGDTLVLAGFAGQDAVTAAVDAGTGELRWSLEIPAGDAILAHLELDADGSHAYVLVPSLSVFSHMPASLARVNVQTGVPEWVVDVTPMAGFRADEFAVSPDGTRVIVSGRAPSHDTPLHRAYLVAYDGATGSVRWATAVDSAGPVAFGRDGSCVHVASSYAASVSLSAYTVSNGAEIRSHDLLLPYRSTQVHAATVNPSEPLLHFGGYVGQGLGDLKALTVTYPLAC